MTLLISEKSTIGIDLYAFRIEAKDKTAKQFEKIFS